MSESSALWGPEALFNPLRLLLVLALPLHPLPLSPCLTPLIAIDFLQLRFIFLSLYGKDGGEPDPCLLESRAAVLSVCIGCDVRAQVHVKVLR